MTKSEYQIVEDGERERERSVPHGAIVFSFTNQSGVVQHF